MDKETLRKKIIPILHYCQAYKADLVAESDDDYQRDTSQRTSFSKQKLRKYFYAYYSGLFCRMLYYLESYNINQDFIKQCQSLIEKYNWFDLQDSDFKKYTDNSNWEEYKHSEVPVLLDYSTLMPELDAPMDHRIVLAGAPAEIADHPTPAGWEYADIRGAIRGQLCE